MPLPAGTRIGPYEIIGVLGAGGMGEVYRGRDARLGRDAALKLLPDALAADPDRVARFVREAQVLASLSHPNIGGIYGLEETETPSGARRALVLELVEGETLADRIARGAVPVDEALPIAHQIAEALQAAHDQSVVHRDLKPANIKITPDGVVKVLDFGLAKLAGRPETSHAAQHESSSAIVTFAPDAADDAPTMTTPAVTAVGSILGTAAYMAPEQAKGRQADKRSDIWALGCVMYEMLTGIRPFRGEDVADTLAAVLRSEPDWSRLPPDVPTPIVSVMRRCLEKDRRARVGDVAAVLFALDHARTSSPAAVVTPAAAWRPRLITIAASSVIAAAIGGGAVWMLTRPAASPLTRLVIAPDPRHALAMTADARDVAISRDGRRIAYVGGDGRLFVRALDSLEPAAIEGLEGPQSPAFSPDGQSIAFIRRNSDVRVVAAAGGPSERRGQLDSAQPGGITWTDDGRIVYATTNRVTGLLELPGGATEPIVLTTPDRERGEADHLWPEFLPGSRAVLFTITQLTGQPGTGQVAVYDFAKRTTAVLVSPGTHARYVPTGHLVYSAAGELRAIRFDLDTLRTVGESRAVGPSVVTKSLGAANFDLSDTGTLVYIPGGVAGGARRELVWVSRDGTVEPLGAPLRTYQYPRLSPDGTRVALDVRDQDNDIWLWDLRTRALVRLTDTPALDRFPAWTPDGEYILFVSDRGGSSAVYRQRADGGGPAEPVTDATPDQQTPTAITSDGRLLLLDFRLDLASVALGVSRRMEMLLQTPSSEMRPALSPDGRWIAYHGNESGQMEVYVRPFPDVASRRWQVSSGGGVEPRWSPRGDELFYVSAATRRLMGVRIAPASTWSPIATTVIFEEPYFWGTTAGAAAATYDIAADGRFLMIRGADDADATAPNLIVVQNWFDELRRLLP